MFGVWGLLTLDHPFLSEPGWLAVMWFLGGYALDVGWCAWGIHKLTDDFRPAAARHFEPVQFVPKRGRLKPVSVWSFDPLKRPGDARG